MKIFLFLWEWVKYGKRKVMEGRGNKREEFRR
jgi:hypothetical protein